MAKTTRIMSTPIQNTLKELTISYTEELILVSCCPGTGTGLDQPPAVASPTIYKLAGKTLVYGVTENFPAWKSTIILYKPDVAGPGIFCGRL